MAQQLSVFRTFQPHSRCSSTDGNKRQPQLIRGDTRLMAWHASSCITSCVCAIHSVCLESWGVKRWICCTEEILSAPWVPLASWLSWTTWRGKHSVCTSCAIELLPLKESGYFNHQSNSRANFRSKCASVCWFCTYNRFFLLWTSEKWNSPPSTSVEVFRY